MPAGPPHALQSSLASLTGKVTGQDSLLNSVHFGSVLDKDSLASLAMDKRLAPVNMLNKSFTKVGAFTDTVTNLQALGAIPTISSLKGLNIAVDTFLNLSYTQFSKERLALQASNNGAVSPQMNDHVGVLGLHFCAGRAHDFSL